MYIKIEDERVASFARTDNAVKAFRDAVNNGQSRFAMEVLVSIIDHLTADQEISATKVDQEAKPAKEDSPKAEQKPTPQKATTKVAQKEEKVDSES